MPKPTPDDVRPQHEEARERAVYVRVRTAALKRALRDGELSVPRAIRLDVDDDGDRDLIARRPIGEILLCGRRVGRSGAAKILAVAGIADTKRIGTMTDRQRRQVADLLVRRAPWLADLRDTEVAS